MARPKKPDDDVLSHRLPHIRCTRHMYECIDRNARACGLPVSEYVRRMALDGHITVRQSRDEFMQAQALKRIGVEMKTQTRELMKQGRMPDTLPPLWAKLEILLDDLLNSA